MYVSTTEPAEAPRRSWAPVFNKRSLTPRGVAAISPVVSPSAEWTAAVSPGLDGWSGEVEDLNTF
jgi:hypothetical protein